MLESSAEQNMNVSARSGRELVKTSNEVTI
jgi:hypothetical protein